MLATMFSRRKLDTEDALYEYAIGALARRGRSVAEMKRLLRQRVADDEHGHLLVEVVVARLKQERYLNDTRYATAYSSFRKENEKFGRLRVISDLKAKGVHGDVIDKAVAESYSGANEEQLAREFLRRKRLAKPADQRQAAKVFRTLARAGFTTRVIIRILKKWDVDDEVLTALQSEAADQAGS